MIVICTHMIIMVEAISSYIGKSIRKTRVAAHGDHNKIAINNIFANFKDYCRRKGANFYDYPQLKGVKGNCIILSLHNHKRLVKEGVEVMEVVNDILEEGHNHFTVRRDVNTSNSKCFWYKVRCPYCKELMTLCPLKKTLKMNIRNHL